MPQNDFEFHVESTQCYVIYEKKHTFRNETENKTVLGVEIRYYYEKFTYP